MDPLSTANAQGSSSPIEERGIAPAIIIPGRTEREGEREFMLDFIQRSNAKRQDFLDIWDEVLENYLVSFPKSGVLLERGFNQVETQNGLVRASSRLKDPETHQIVESLSGQALGLLLGARDYMTTMPVGLNDYEKSRFLAKTLMAALDEPGVYRTIYELYKDSFIFGTSIVEIAWETRVRPQMSLVPFIDPQTGRIGRKLMPQMVVYRDRPLLRPVDIYDFYPDPSGTRIQENMTGVIKRFHSPRYRIEAMGGKDGPYHLQDALQRALDVASDSEASEEEQGRKRFQPYRGASKYQPMTGFEFWGTVPWQPADGFTNRVITMINGEIVRSHINPFIDGMIPFKEIVMNPVSGRFYGLGPAEVVRFLQDSTDTLLESLTDAVDLAVRAPIFVGRGADVDKNRVQRRLPNDIIDCGDPTKIQPMEQDLSGMVLALQDIVRRKQTMREATGRTDPVQAITKTGEQTATEISTLAQAATQRVDVMVRLTEREDFPWIGKTIHSRIRQFIPERGLIAVLGSEQFPFTLDDIDFDADIRFVGSRDGKSKIQRMNELQAALTVLGSAGELLYTMPELIIRYLRDGLDIEEAEEIVIAAIQRQAALQDMMLATGGEQGAQKGKASPPRQQASK